MKTCFKCGMQKPIDSFYRHKMMADGRLGKCIDCTRKDVSERERRLRATSPEWLEKERERCRNKTAKARKIGISMAPSKEVRQRYALANKHKRKAETKANRAQKRGLLKKPERCQHCGHTTNNLEKHHSDYTKPLEVEWLCTTCHGKTRWLRGAITATATHMVLRDLKQGVEQFGFGVNRYAND